MQSSLSPQITANLDANNFEQGQFEFNTGKIDDLIETKPYVTEDDFVAASDVKVSFRKLHEPITLNIFFVEHFHSKI